ncbi:uncharacterized protein J3D65DRAFT_643147 [Phyllosticta citribraziliensis]|uniref:Uncharacterized protein n=1 Tax=Phyllosticta citribraziliensis TaxID=989973 RepID=A0ABR1L1N2_9PEZI
MAPLGPYKLVTVNSVPERAKRLVGRVCEDVKDRYLIEHAGNADDISQVEAVVRQVQPDLLFTASMWTPQQSQEAQEVAKRIVPGIKTFALPQGLQADQGPDAVVEFIKDHLPALIEGR